MSVGGIVLNMNDFVPQRGPVGGGVFEKANNIAMKKLLGSTKEQGPVLGCADLSKKELADIDRCIFECFAQEGDK